jgi:hypothetical protein
MNTSPAPPIPVPRQASRLGGFSHGAYFNTTWHAYRTRYGRFGSNRGGHLGVKVASSFMA